MCAALLSVINLDILQSQCGNEFISTAEYLDFNQRVKGNML